MYMYLYHFYTSRPVDPQRTVKGVHAVAVCFIKVVFFLNIITEFDYGMFLNYKNQSTLTVHCVYFSP